MNQVSPLRHRSALEASFFAIVVFISLVSLSAVTLLSLEVLTPSYVAISSIASLIPALTVLKRCRPTPRLTRAEWIVIALAALAFGLRWNTSTYLYGGQDPGVYSNIASYFADHGTWIVKDQLLGEFEGRKDLKDYYLATSFYRKAINVDGVWRGNMLPGVYLKNLDTNEWVSQFYHVNTVWLAIGQWMFGQEWKGLTLSFLSSLSILAAYLLTVRISRSPIAGMIAAFLLATNAAHSYIGTFPVSEAVAGFFFLSALTMLTAGWQFTSLLPLAALFLTRITGFLTAPLILASLAWMVVKRRDTKAVWTGLGVLAAYAMSVMWGLRFSASYAKDIYRGKLGMPSSFLEHVPATFVALCLVWFVGCSLALRYNHRLKALCAWLVRHRAEITLGAISLMVLVIGVRGYLLAFTDHYVKHRWFGIRWNMAGHGVDSLRYLSIYTLNLMISPLGVLALLVGLAQSGKLALKRATTAPFAICAFGFFAALTIKQLTTPYLYYFGRYLVSEVLPLAIICGAIALDSLSRALPRFKYILPVVYCASVFIILYPALSARLRIREGHQFYEAMSCLDEATPGRSVLLIDKRNFPDVPVVTALRFAFNKPTFTLRESDFSSPEKLGELIGFFESKGYTVHLLSSSDTWASKGGFTKIARVPAIMRQLSGRAETPTQIRTLSYPIRLYSRAQQVTLPEICKKVAEYPR